MEKNLTYYREVEWPKVKESLKEWSEDFSLEYRNKCRKEYLRDQIETVRQQFFYECKQLVKRTDNLLYHTEKHIAGLEKQLYRLGMELKIVDGKAEAISPEKIARARQYPIENLIQVRRGMALCPFHRERTPSFDVRKNFYYCYGCGATGDVIDFVMKEKNLTFKQAVDFLV